MTDFRALCAELVDALAEQDRCWMLINDARAALAQPAPQGPTDEELFGLEELRDAWNAQADAMNTWDELGMDEIIWFAQQQALARWGHHALPVPQLEG